MLLGMPYSVVTAQHDCSTEIVNDILLLKDSNIVVTHSL